MGAYGDAGAVITRKPDLAEKIRKLSDHGRVDKYVHDIIGYNHRLDALQAAILSVKLKYLSQWTARRRQVAAYYDDCLRNLGVKYVVPEHNSNPVYHLYVIEVDEREKLQKKLEEHGIASGIHYPVPLHLQPAFKDYGYSKGDFPVTELFSKRILSLPICGSLTDSEVEYICSKLKILL